MLSNFFKKLFQKEIELSNISQLIDYIERNSSFVSQVTLYPYLKTRAGTQHPKLFENEKFLSSLRISRWHIYISCVNDMSIFISSICAKDHNYTNKIAYKLAEYLSTTIFKKIKQNDIDDDEFHLSVKNISKIYKGLNLNQITKRDVLFKKSADDLIKWAPVSEQFKKEDETILRNSINFRWIPIRKEVHQNIDTNEINKQWKTLNKDYS